MTTVSTMISDRASAGSDYVAALAALKAAWIAVRKYDITLANHHVQALAANPQSLAGMEGRSFGQASTWDPSCMRHAEFAAPEYLVSWEADANAAAQTLIANAS